MPPEIKPLNWTPDPNIGYHVIRRSDGGMHFTFTDLSEATLKHWHNFASEHLYDSDRLTRNLYDLRQVHDIPEKAIRFAVEANSDPAARNIRLAVVVADEKVRQAVLDIRALTVTGGVELGVFIDMPAAEAWLDRPLTTLV